MPSDRAEYAVWVATTNCSRVVVTAAATTDGVIVIDNGNA